MSGSKENARAEEVRELVEEIMPGTIFHSRKPTNSGATVRDIETGQVLLRGEKNWDIADIITAKDFVPPKPKRLKRLVDVKQKSVIKTIAENEAVKGIGHTHELGELMQENPRIVYDDDGSVKSYRFSTMEFTITGGRAR